MRRWVLTAALLLVLTGVAQAEEPKLRRWYFGLQGVDTWRNTYEVFGLEGLPPGDLKDGGGGVGGLFGVRFGGRFLLGLQLVYSAHEIIDRPEIIADVEFLFTGTVLFREKDTWQPFLRGGLGGAGEYLDRSPNPGNLFAYGTGAIAGGGLQVRLSSRFSLDLEVVSTFANFLEVNNDSGGAPWPEESWKIRESNWGWRLGLGAMVWF